MPKRFPPSAVMTRPQVIGGIVFMPFYLIILQYLIVIIYMLIIRRNPDTHDAGTIMLITYYVYFFITVFIFRRYLAESLKIFVRNITRCLKYFAFGYALVYVANIVIALIISSLGIDVGNTNNEAVFDYLEAARGATIASVVFLAPVVEETIFRGLIFDNIRKRSRLAAYIISCLAFAFLHIWSSVILEGDLAQLILIVEYIPAGFFLAWAFEKSGSIWTPIVLHAVINAMSVGLADMLK